MKNLLKSIYEKPRLYGAMLVTCKAIVLLFGIGFLFLCHGAYCKEPISLLKVGLICLLPFIIVTVIRRIINAPRPYEIYDFYEKRPKDKSGRSFPSRHLYSASVISSLCFFIYPVLGAALSLLAILLALIRVLVGIHFIRDVCAGALIGVSSALLGVLILAPF